MNKVSVAQVCLHCWLHNAVSAAEVCDATDDAISIKVDLIKTVS